MEEGYDVVFINWCGVIVFGGIFDGEKEELVCVIIELYELEVWIE